MRTGLRSVLFHEISTVFVWKLGIKIIKTLFQNFYLVCIWWSMYSFSHGVQRYIVLSHLILGIWEIFHTSVDTCCWISSNAYSSSWEFAFLSLIFRLFLPAFWSFFAPRSTIILKIPFISSFLHRACLNRRKKCFRGICSQFQIQHIFNSFLTLLFKLFYENCFICSLQYQLIFGDNLLMFLHFFAGCSTGQEIFIYHQLN